MSIPTQLTIGTLVFESPVLFAPLAGYSDFAFRQSLRELGGVGLAYTEMLSPASLLMNKVKKLKTLIATSDADSPLGYQIYGTHPDKLAKAAEWLEQHGARLVDINMGCPQRKISTHGAGAGLLRTPDEAVGIAAQVVKAVSIPVTVKLRLGWDLQTLVAHELVPRLENAGVAAVTIHGRTRAQGYTGQADLDQIRKVVQSASRIPVIGNGDVTSPATARNMFTETGCAAIMIGRGAMKNPWLIRDVRNDLKGLPPAPAPTREEWVRFALGHFDRMVELYGPKGASLLYRKWIPQYLRRLLAGRQHLVTMMMIEEAPLMRNAIEALFEIRPVEVPPGMEDKVSTREEEEALLEGRGAFSL